MFRFFQRDRMVVILSIVIILMGVEIVYLIIQNRRLQALLADPKSYFQTLVSKDVVPSFTAADLDGREVDVRYGPGSPATLIFLFSPGCSSCEGNLETWNDLTREYAGVSLRCLGFCSGGLEETRAFVVENGITFPVICVDNPFIIEAYKGNILPQTVLVSPEGQVLRAWPGILGPQDIEAVRAALGGPQPPNRQGGETQ